MDNKFNTYCKIIDYLDADHPKIAELIRGLCAEANITSFKGKKGITFLLPAATNPFLAKLEKLAVSTKIEEANKASDMLNALILRDVFKSSDDWTKKEVANSIFPSQLLEVASSSGNEVTFKNGAKATLDTTFKNKCRKDNLAVWILNSGEIPVTTDKPARKTVDKQISKNKVGSYDPGSYENYNQRFKIALAVENSYAYSMLQQDGKKTDTDVYLETTFSLIYYILHVLNDEQLIINKVLPLISLDKFDFYVLIEPHRVTGNFLLPDTIINQWWGNRHSYISSIKQIHTELEKLLGNNHTALVYSDRKSLLDAVMDKRRQLMSMSNAQPRAIVDNIDQIYKEIETTNKLDDVGPIFPDDLAAYYADNPGLKMLHDELRYLTYGAFKELEMTSFDIGRFHEITNMIGECLYTSTNTNISGKLLNKESIKYLISPNEKIAEIKIFLYSTMFVFIPTTSAELDDIKIKYTVYRPDPHQIVLFNISKDLYTQHHRILTQDSTHNNNIIEALKSLNLDTLDPVLKHELMNKFKSIS